MRCKWMKSAKLSWKIAGTYVLLFSLVMIGLGTVVFCGVKYYLDKQSKQRIEEIAQATTDTLLGTLEEQPSLYDEVIVAQADQDTTINIKIADQQGNIVNNSNNFLTPDILLSGSGKIYGTSDELLVKNFPVISEGEILAEVQIAQDMRVPYGFLKTLLKWMAISDAAGIVISFLIGWMVSKNMLKPISKMIRTASEIGSTGLSNRIAVPPSDDELSQLSITFNEMLDRIEDSFVRQGRFTASASHELRTPLTVIQGYIGMLDRWGKHDEKITQEAIDAIQSETCNMIYIMERLLFLARGDNGSQIIEKEDFPVGEMMGELEKETLLMLPGNKISFRFEEAVTICADEKLIKQMLRAVLDNSIKYTPSEGRIELACFRQKDQLIFEISDTGMGIPREDQEHIFERFYRVDKARARRTGGSGLGLSIVQWIVEAHEGHIEIESTEEKGTTVTIALPLNCQGRPGAGAGQGAGSSGADAADAAGADVSAP